MLLDQLNLKRENIQLFQVLGTIMRKRRNRDNLSRVLYVSLSESNSLLFNTTYV